MVSRNNLNDLRNEVRKLQRNAGNKISRMKRSTGVEVSGSEFDPRRNLDRVKGYTTRQLESFANQLREFNSRGTQFVPVRDNKPVPRKEWQAYSQAENEVNRKREQTYGPLANKKLPTGETVSQRMAKMKPDHPMMGNPANKTDFHPIKREPLNIKDRNALKKLTSTLKKNMTKSYDKKLLKSHRAEFAKMVEFFNDPSLVKTAKSLTNVQFHALWNLTKFPDAVSLMYAKMKATLQPGQKPNWADSVIQDQWEDAKESLEWAKNL